MNIVVFEDRAVSQLFPITTGRPAYSITCGSYCLMDWLEEISKQQRDDGAIFGRVRSHLRNIQAHTNPEWAQPLDQTVGLSLVVNARCVPSVDCYRKLSLACSEKRELVFRDDHQLAAAIVPTTILHGNCEADLASQVESYARQRPITQSDQPLHLFDFPHEVVDYHLRTIESSLEHRVQSGKFRQVSDRLYVAPGAEIDASTIINPDGGLVLVDRDARIGPYCFIDGPAYLGPRSRVIEHSAIKDKVSIGHTTKIGGEVEASIIESYTNKQHHGFLGHSYLGSWINLGAGTCNSDLKNTYGTVNMEYGNQKVNTNMQFVGCIMGDYAKTAINTGIFTGKLIGTCSMIYGFVTTNVPSFVNYARLFGQITELPASVMAATQKRMFARRNVEQRPVDVQLLHDMYELTRHERQLAEEPLVL